MNGKKTEKTEWVVRSIRPHYQFKLVCRKQDPRPQVCVPFKKRTFWARGPNEAIDIVKSVLGMKDFNPEIFRQAGGRKIIKVLSDDNRPKTETIYPF